MRLHDFLCPTCGVVELDVQCTADEEPKCAQCMGRMKITLEHWPTVNTDVYGQPRKNLASGKYYSSQREADRDMRRLGFEPCGDLVHGARVVERSKPKKKPVDVQGALHDAVEREHDSLQRCPKKGVLRRALGK